MKLSLSALIAAAGTLHAGLTPIAEHVDIRWKWTALDGWTCQAITDSNGEVAYEPQNIFFAFSDKPYAAGNPANSGARFTQPASAAFAFTGVAPGQPLWVAVQGTPGIGEAWPGLENNQDTTTFGSYIPSDLRVSQTLARPWLKISLVSYTPPPGTDSHFSLWTTSGSVPKIWMSTFETNTVNDYYYAAGSHTHANWGFSQLGIHRVRLKAFAFAGPGETNPTGFSATHTFTLAIGPFAQWQATHFSASELDDLATSGPAADPDGDGMKNLVEFGFGYDPRNGANIPQFPGLSLPQISLIQESGIFYEILDYPARRAGVQVAPLQYFPQFSANLNWLPETITTTASDFPPAMNNLNPVWQKITARRAFGPNSPARSFGRVMLQTMD